MLTVGDRFPAFALQAAVSLEKGKEFREITSASDPGRWKVVFDAVRIAATIHAAAVALESAGVAATA